ncbi:AAA family ATPase [Allokutzneria sp. A3M-2-11 16]|uniref:ATP-binding protein n=1 Tax=Allokutzneria sp. A3M-2-11 16 TaxID=2962043 RepID=UPI0020B71D9A|nr:BTAD domain-containing putative transcriptional regulator [Allokutzneria sp. A3M-2-11 16]MCP3804074.1 AAA family ATPase [Allokutzneria sp. A3M-2-11 16]
MTTELTLLPRVAYRDHEITGPRLRGLLALLAADLRTGCSTGRLIEGLWPDALPENPTKALQVLVSRVRSQLRPDLVVSTPTGYRLALAEDQVDASAVVLSAATSARHARAGDHAAALEHAEAGLALWRDAERGEPVPDDPVSALRAERAGTHRALKRARALALARLGRKAEAVEPLVTLVEELPKDEEILTELLRCEPAPAALARYDAYRRALRAELGVDPGPELQAVYHALLRGETPTVRHGVPHEPNPLLGRDDDIDAVLNLLRTSRVASIVGAGGLGKTRLAHAVGMQAEQRAVYFVALAGLPAEGEVVRAVASALGLRESAQSDLVPGIARLVGSESVLLVLDNCEHVIHGVAELVRALVSMTANLRVLTTSRAPLGLSSESVYLLPELGLPTSVELFGQRARAARPDVDLPVGVVEALCGQLDGLPLAVELAAARVRAMSVTEITSRLQDRFALLRGRARDVPQRHRTLHAVVDWSWALLDAAGQAAMRALSVFPGGFSVEAAERLVGAEDALELLESLVDQSLIKVADTSTGTRFRMLETVREFAAARREAAGDSARVEEDFLSWAREFGVEHYDLVFGGPTREAVGRVRAEQDNLVLALRTGVRRGDGTVVAAVSATLGGMWVIESNYAQLALITREVADVLYRFRPEPELVEPTRVTAVLTTTTTFMVIGPRATRSYAVLRRLPPPSPRTVCGALAIVLCARDTAELEAMCLHPEPFVAGMANVVAGYLWENLGEPERALEYTTRVLDCFRDGTNPLLISTVHGRLSELCLHLERAEESREHSRAAVRALGGFRAFNTTQMRLGLVLTDLQVGDVESAERGLAAITPDRLAEAVEMITFEMAARAEVLLARGEVELGLRQWRRVAERVVLGDDESPVAGTDQLGVNPWHVEVHGVTVVAHARHGRTDLVAGIVESLPDSLAALLAGEPLRTPSVLMVRPLCGTLLVAMGMADIARGDASGVRLIALGECFRFQRAFQPTMSSAAIRAAAEHADGPAYADAVSEYAGRSPDELCRDALDVLRVRARR